MTHVAGCTTVSLFTWPIEIPASINGLSFVGTVQMMNFLNFPLIVLVVSLFGFPLMVFLFCFTDQVNGSWTFLLSQLVMTMGWSENAFRFGRENLAADDEEEAHK